MLANINNSWQEFLSLHIEQLERINGILDKENKTIYPPRELIFNSLKLTPLENVSVLLLGQDPYHGPNQAMGLSFSVPRDVKIPPSLRNIYKELQSDLGITTPKHGDLSNWAKQGVLLLNASLSVIEKMPNSHEKIWADFTDNLIAYISEKCDFVVFLLWGNFAKSKSKFIHSRHKILTSAHPSPLSARHFLGCKHFSKTNEELVKHNKTPIRWEDL